MILNKKNIRQHVRCVIAHHADWCIEDAAQIIADHWNHKKFEIDRNIKSMKEDSKDNLPCHLVLTLSNCHQLDADLEGLQLTDNMVVGHVKLTRADGRSDGPCCISFSLVVKKEFRGLGLGRILTEEAEDFARSLKMAYMYLSTDDQVKFYEHVGYRQCEPVSSLGENSKRLSASQVQSLEGLFAKRLNIASPTVGNTWLRKRLIVEYPLIEPLSIDELSGILSKQLEDMIDNNELAFSNSNKISGCSYIYPMFRQPQTGPSCGIAALNMAIRSVRENHDDFIASECSVSDICDCIGEIDRSSANKTAESLLELAQNLGVSSDGELFCAYNLAYLSKSFFSIPLTVNELNSDSKLNIIKSLVSGFPVLIPYDRSFADHKPSLHSGTHAHWAVIAGFMIMKDSEYELTFGDSRPLDIGSYGSIAILNSPDAFRPNKLEHLDESRVCLVCFHGMSMKPFVCTLDRMIESCQQLKESKSKFYKSSEDMAHLRNKIVFFSKCKFL